MSKRFQAVKVNDPECFQKLPPNVLLGLVDTVDTFTGKCINFEVVSGDGGGIFEVVESLDSPVTAGNADLTDATGNGSVTDISVSESAVVEDWTITCTDDSVSGSEVWSVEGSVSGLQTAEATTGVEYTSDTGLINFKIVDGSTDFSAADVIVIAAVQPAAYIKAKVDCRIIIEGLTARTSFSSVGGVQVVVGDATNFYGQKAFSFITGQVTPVDSPFSLVSCTVILLAGEGISLSIPATDGDCNMLNLQVSSVFPE